jgi:pimeloyl-ACP methyl ester carboxylesterase
LLTADLWRPQIASLGGRYRPDVAENALDDTVAAMAARVLRQAPERFSLVAHAMGGFIAFEIMRRAPQRVARLALLSTLARADTPVQTERRLGYLRLVQSGQFAGVVDERIPLLLHPNRRDDTVLIDAVRSMAADTGAEAFLRQQRAIMSRPDSRPGLSAIACPTLILFGAQDGIVTLEHQEEMRAAVAGARLEVIEDCGHLVTLEAPEAVNRILAAWL